jgi:hypothetical protein
MLEKNSLASDFITSAILGLSVAGCEDLAPASPDAEADPVAEADPASGALRFVLSLGLSHPMVRSKTLRAIAPFNAHRGNCMVDKRRLRWRGGVGVI